MRVLVAIPTYNNVASGYTIRHVLNALAKQTHKNFRLLIVYKPHPNDKTLSIIDEYKDLLDIEVKTDYGYIEEAMNVIFDIAKDYDLVLTLDDDSVPCSDWVRQHVSMHQALEKIGLLGGLTQPSSPVCSKYEFVKRPIGKMLGYYKPLYDIYEYYISYVNDMGFTVCLNNKITKIYGKTSDNLDELLNKAMFVLSSAAWIGGCNMSIKSKYVDGFKLPGITYRGIGYERALTTYIVKQKGHTALFNGGKLSI